MLDEGISREVINRIQRLRKKANLQPNNEVKQPTTDYFRKIQTILDIRRE